MSRRSMTAAMFLVLGACAGCGTAEYEKRLGQAVQTAKQDSVFSQMRPAVALAGTPIRIQLSQNLEATPLADGTDPRRLKPPAAQTGDVLVDRKLTFEGFQQYQGGKMALYCYVAATDMAALAGRDPMQSLIRQIRQLYPAWSGQTETVQCVSVDGTAQAWQRVRATGQ